MKNFTLLLIAFISIGVSGQLMGMQEQPQKQPNKFTSFLVKYVPQKTAYQCGGYGSFKDIPAHFEHVKTFEGEPSQDLKTLTTDLQAVMDQNTRKTKYFANGEVVYKVKITNIPLQNTPMFKVDIEQKN